MTTTTATADPFAERRAHARATRPPGGTVELLPATYPSEARAWDYSRYLNHHVLDVVPATEKDKAGRFRIKIVRVGKRDDA